MEDENYLMEQISMLQAHYNYVWANNYTNKHTPFGKERKEMVNEISKQIQSYQQRLDKARTINQIESMLELYRNMQDQLEHHMSASSSNSESEINKHDHEYLVYEIEKLENRLFELNELV